MGVHALYTAASGMDAQLRNIDVIANNIANLGSSGFRKDRVNFADLFYRNQALAGSTGTGPEPRPSGLHVGHGTRVVGTQKLFATTPPRVTDVPTDVAIQGPGNLFFQVELANGQIGYTRAGNFQIDDQGILTLPTGQPLFGIQPVPLDGQIQVETNGDVFASTDQNPDQPQNLGRILLTRFVNPAGLTPKGDNLFIATPAAGEPQLVDAEQEIGVSLLGGFLEGSNVNAIQEMVALIQGQRAYEINSNVIQTADQALQVANNLRG